MQDIATGSFKKRVMPMLKEALFSRMTLTSKHLRISRTNMGNQLINFVNWTMVLLLKEKVANKPMATTMKALLMPPVALLRDHTNLKMGLFILVNGLTVSEMVMVAKYGLMVPVMKVLGPMTKPTDTENSFTPMVMFMKEIGSMIRQRDMEPIVMLMEHTMMVIGLMISSTVMAKNLGLMVLVMRVTILKARRRAKVS